MFHRKIYRKALSQKLNRSDLKRITHAMYLSILCSIAALFVIVLDCLQNKWTNVFFDFISLGLFASLFFLFRRGKFALGKMMIFIAGSNLMVFNASREGVMAGNQFLFYPLFIGPLLFFSKKEWKYSVAIWILITSVFIFLESTDYSFFIYKYQDPKLLYINYLFCFFLTLIILAVFVLSFDKITWESEQKLEKVNKRLAYNISDLKKANTELDSFVYKASHDLRSPLTSLMGLIELAKTEKDPAVLDYYMNLEEKIVLRLDNYIVDILNISRNARMPLKKDRVHLKDVFESVYNQLSFYENADKIKYEITITGTEFYTDVMRITIVLNNLISNAIRYCDMSKQEQWIKFTVDVNDETCIMKFTDNGVGIREEHMDKVFLMFYRATDNKNGSGLGLYIMKEIIDNLKGEVAVSSEYGKWTEFIITLPNLKKDRSAG